MELRLVRPTLRLNLEIHHHHRHRDYYHHYHHHDFVNQAFDLFRLQNWAFNRLWSLPIFRISFGLYYGSWSGTQRGSVLEECSFQRVPVCGCVVCLHYISWSGNKFTAYMFCCSLFARHEEQFRFNCVDIPLLFLLTSTTVEGWDSLFPVCTSLCPVLSAVLSRSF